VVVGVLAGGVVAGSLGDENERTLRTGHVDDVEQEDGKCNE
jgi:hypothetical protein